MLAFQLEVVLLGFGHKLEQKIKNVEISFSWRLADDAAFLQEVVSNGGLLDAHGFRVDFDGDKFSEPGRVVIFDGFGVSKGLKDGIALEDFELEVVVGEMFVGLEFLFLTAVADGAETLFVGLGFSGSGLT